MISKRVLIKTNKSILLNYAVLSSILMKYMVSKIIER